MSRALLVAVLGALPSLASAQNAVIDIGEDSLNRLVQRLGVLGDTGVTQPTSVAFHPGFEMCEPVGFLDCPGAAPDGMGFLDEQIPLARCRMRGGGYAVVPIGPPTLWQWWVSAAAFDIEAGQMHFQATVTWRGGADHGVETRRVPAAAEFSGSTNRIRLVPGAFKVPVQTTVEGRLATLTVVDVARLFTIAVPITPQVLSIPGLGGGAAHNVTASARSVQVQYRADSLRLTVDVGF